MSYLNNFYFRMLIKSAKMTKNINNKKEINNIIKLFYDKEPLILPHTWMTYCIDEKWNITYLKLIKKRFIQDTILLVKKLKKIEISEQIVEECFDKRAIFQNIFEKYDLKRDTTNIFYYNDKI